MSPDFRVAVIIPSFRRPQWLRRCLAALDRQELRPSRIVVALKDGDSSSHDVIATFAQRDAGAIVESVSVAPSCNVIAQQAAALAATSEEFVAITDDDAEPRPDWLARMVPYFAADPNVVGVGGRDWQPHERIGAGRVGTLSWFGRATGNHHLGVGPARDVEMLKGVNCCFRGPQLRSVGFDSRMRGRGTVVHWEMSLCLTLRRRGYRLIYDPAIAVDHHVAPRRDSDTNDRGLFDAASLADGVHNETLSLLEHLSVPNRMAFIAYAGLVGTRQAPGLAHLARMILAQGDVRSSIERYSAALRGRLAGLLSCANLTSRTERPSANEFAGRSCTPAAAGARAAGT